MAKKDRIDELIEAADAQAALVQSGKLDPLRPVLPDNGQPADIAPGMMRIHIVCPDHTDGIQKKTWLRDSVIELDIAAAEWMVNVAKAAYPTSEPIHEILAPYKGK